MRLLLDTHIWLWSVLEPTRLAKRIASALQDASNEIWLSPISAWELMMLAGKGRITLDAEPAIWIRRALKTTPFKEAPVNHEVAIQSQLHELPHGDPADRLLAATAVVYDLTLVTSDERLWGSRGFSVLENK